MCHVNILEWHFRKVRIFLSDILLQIISFYFKSNFEIQKSILFSEKKNIYNFKPVDFVKDISIFYFHSYFEG